MSRKDHAFVMFVSVVFACVVGLAIHYITALVGRIPFILAYTAYLIVIARLYLSRIVHIRTALRCDPTLTYVDAAIQTRRAMSRITSAWLAVCIVTSAVFAVTSVYGVPVYLDSVLHSLNKQSPKF